MAAESERHRMTIEEYLAMDRASNDVKYEYYDGIIRAMTGGSLKHSRIKIRCVSLLEEALVGKPCQPFDSDARVQLSASTYVYPDATVSCYSEDMEGDVINSPRVVFEVLSPSTENVDRSRKFRAYRACFSIEEYVLINTTKPLIEVFRRNGRFLTYLDFGPDDILDLTSIGVQIPVAEIYRGIEFPPDEDDL
jgi:Uma2 family endonuclease